VSETKKLVPPAWYKNTYFWISALLLVLGFIGLIAGDNSIRDPGQKVEQHLWLLYFVASVVMLVGGIVSHKQTVQQYQEDMSSKA
jgi:4-amino-4-deoxy-L-arabinose transferase-like glycosyltransferase